MKIKLLLMLLGLLMSSCSPPELTKHAEQSAHVMFIRADEAYTQVRVTTSKAESSIQYFYLPPAATVAVGDIVFWDEEINAIVFMDPEEYAQKYGDQAQHAEAP